MNENIFSAEDNLKTIDESLSYYRSEAIAKGDEVRKEAYEIIDSIVTKKDDLTKKINEVKKESGNALEDMQIGVDMAVADLNIAYLSAKERLNKVLS